MSVAEVLAAARAQVEKGEAAVEQAKKALEPPTTAPKPSRRERRAQARAKSTKAKQGGHVRLTNPQIRANLKNFDEGMRGMILEALNKSNRAVIVCAKPGCHSLNIVSKEQAAKTWSEHVRSK